MGSFHSQLSGSGIGAIEKRSSDGRKRKEQFLSSILQTIVSSAINFKIIIKDIDNHQSKFKFSLTLGFGETTCEPKLYNGTRQQLIYCCRKASNLGNKCVMR